MTPSRRTDRAVLAGVHLDAPVSRVTRCASAATSGSTTSDNQTDTNARGAFVFTGLYASGGSATRRAAAGSISPTSCSGCRSRRRCSTGPGNVRMSGKSLSAFLQDDWRKSGTLTFNLGVRYELIRPFYERGGSDGEPRRRARASPRRSRCSPGDDGPVHGRVSQGAAQRRRRTTSRRASASPGG